MKTWTKALLHTLALWLAFATAHAAEIRGTVTGVAEKHADVTADSDLLPASGDKVEIFFKLPGSSDEISVASGHVAQVKGAKIRVAIDNATGAVAKGQLVRIELGGKSQRTETRPATQNTGANPLRGDWMTEDKGGKISFSFKDDNTMLWVVEQPPYAQSTTGQYRVDTSVSPHVVEISDIAEGEMKGKTLYGLFELQSDGRLKIDLGDTRDRGWNEKETIVLSRATSPIVRPATVLPPTPTPDPRPMDEQKTSVGNDRYNVGDYDGAIAAYTEAINLNPKNGSAYFGRGRAFLRKGDKDSALADYTKSMELDPSESTQNGINEIKSDMSGALVSKGYAEKGKLNGLPDAVLRDTTKAIELNPKNAGAYTQRGFYYYQNGDHAAAVRDFNQAIALDPEGTHDLKDLVQSINAEDAPKKKKSKQ